LPVTAIHPEKAERSTVRRPVFYFLHVRPCFDGKEVEMEIAIGIIFVVCTVVIYFNSKRD